MFLNSVESVAGKEVLMKLSRLIGPTTAALIFLTLLAMFNLASAQGPASLLAHAKGKGTLTVGKEGIQGYQCGCETDRRWHGRNHAGYRSPVVRYGHLVQSGRFWRGYRSKDYGWRNRRWRTGIRETVSAARWEVNRQIVNRGDEQHREKKNPA